VAVDEGIANQDQTTDRMTQIRMELDQESDRPATDGSLRLPGDEPAPADAHMNILRTLVNLEASDTPQRQGPAGQQPRRALEQVVRRRAVECADRLTEAGRSHVEAAQRLGVKPRTLRCWRDACRAETPLPLLGRPLTRVEPAQRQIVTSWLDQVGPGVGVPTLRLQFPGLARAAVADLITDYRGRWRAENRRSLHVLHWLRAGTVWAMDFAQAPRLIDGRYQYALAVRDLASGQQLLWQPVMTPTAEVVLAELDLLFALYGAPWVLKTDNGSAFIAEVVRWYLQRCAVYQLFSPPLAPAYNGSIEASIGSMKRRTQQHSELADHGGIWTSIDLNRARIEANTTARPRRLHGLTPQQAWDARPPLNADQRQRFDATVAQRQLEARTERGLTADEPLTRAEQAAVDRAAFSRALVAHDLLLFRRRSIPPRITRPKVAIEG
jgi:hypothetical protein